MVTLGGDLVSGDIHDELQKVGDVYDEVLPRIQQLRHRWDLERVQRPDLYGPAPKSVWRRLRAWAKRRPREVEAGK